MIGWASKREWKGTAHYIEADGAPACQKMKRIDGTPLLAPFKCTWTQRRLHDRLCRLCLQKHAGVCRCGRCTTERPMGQKESQP
jgi:hypothetical protein